MEKDRKDRFVNIGDLYIDLEEVLGCSYKMIPKKYRDDVDGTILADKFNAEVGDLACDPRSGGIGGFQAIADRYGVGEQQFRKNILPKLSYIRWYARWPVTHVWSAEADGVRYQNEMRTKRYGNLYRGVDFDVTSNWI